MKEMAHTSFTSLPFSLEIPTEADASSSSSGIRALMVAVLEDAIKNLGSSVEPERAEAERWIMSREPGYVFSFAVICETLHLEPSAVRRSVMQLLRNKPPRGRLPRRTRSHVRHNYEIQLRSARRSAA